MTLEEAQNLAGKVAGEFDIFECDLFIRKMAKFLGRNFPATVERIRVSDDSEVLVLVENFQQIAMTGFHLGLGIGDLVYDNIHPQGVLATQWAGKYMAATGRPLRADSKSLADFFGKIFLVKRFNHWIVQK